ncbi:hypothetical protein IWX91DRAFT_381142 [Phyllosticta citricarpa]
MRRSQQKAARHPSESYPKGPAKESNQPHESSTSSPTTTHCAALHFDVRIDTAGPFCAAHISVETGPATPPPEQLAVRFPRPAAEWWSDVVGTCNMIRMYRNREHTEQWTREHAPGAGHIAPATAVWKLAGPWYGDRIHPDFQPHTREHNQKLLNDVGFSGLFWKLP